MARINIEDSLYKEKGWMLLLKRTNTHFEALGIVLCAFTLAQKYWLEFGHIPAEKWDDELEVVIECGLAERSPNDRSVYIKGSKEQFSWLTQRSEAGKKSSKNKLKTLKQYRTESEREPNGSHPLSLSLSLSQESNTSVSVQQSENIEKKEEFKQVSSNSATSNFDARFAKDSNLWDQVLDEYGLKKRLRLHLGAIRNSFDTPQALKDFIEFKATCDACKKIRQEEKEDSIARSRIEQFVLVCLKREIGVMS